MKIKQRFKVVPFKNPGGTKAYRVTGCKRDGKQIRLNFPTLLEANEQRNELEREYLSGKSDRNIVTTTLTPEQVALAERVFAEMGDKSPMLAVRYYLDNYKEPVKKCTLADAFTEFMKEKQEGNRRPKTIKDLNDRVGFFARAHPTRQVAEFQLEDLEPYINRGTTTPLGRRNNRSKLSTFFKWATKKKYCQSNPLAECETIRLDETEPEILTMAEVRRLLNAAMTEEGGVTVPYVALGLFAAIRPDELRRLSWDKIKIKNKNISIDGEVAKKRKKRNVAMSDNLIAFLLPYAVKRAPIVGQNWRRIWDRVRVKAGFGTPTKDNPDLKPWTLDVLRHTGISHHLQKHNHEGLTAQWAGNTPDVIQTHYRELVEPEDTEEFWNLTPETVKNTVVQLPQRQSVNG